MDRLKLRNTFLPLVAIFVLVNIACMGYKDALLQHHIDPAVVQVANGILFLLAVVSALMHYRAVKNTNPHAFVRSIMGATVMKLFVIASAVFIYVYMAGSGRSVYAIFIGMGLYVLYTIFEVSGAFRLNKEKDGSH